ncbi:MAG: serine/threonine protein kinase [Chloroflexi bacterium]|nr:serine/threonine protein kinase [Chloroflexota bacterium]
MAQLRHPGIIQVHDFNRDDDVYYMVLEFVPGETIQAHLKRLNDVGRKLSPKQAMEYMANICDAVDYAHQRGMIHRDIKPANIMLNLLGQAILMDFGIAKIVGDQRHTATGAVVGTAMYMSPEQIKGGAARPPHRHLLPRRDALQNGQRTPALQSRVRDDADDDAHQRPGAERQGTQSRCPRGAGGGHQQSAGEGSKSTLSNCRANGRRAAKRAGATGRCGNRSRSRGNDDGQIAHHTRKPESHRLRTADRRERHSSRKWAASPLKRHGCGKRPPAQTGKRNLRGRHAACGKFGSPTGASAGEKTRSGAACYRGRSHRLVVSARRRNFHHQPSVPRRRGSQPARRAYGCRDQHRSSYAKSGGVDSYRHSDRNAGSRHPHPDRTPTS